MRKLIVLFAVISISFSSFSQNILLRVPSGGGTSVSIPVVANIADLKAYTGISTAILLTDTLRSGLFHIRQSTSPLTDDDGVVFKMNDNRFAVRDTSQSMGGVNVRWFGMVPDYNVSAGTGTDNRQALLNAIAAAKATSTASSGTGSNIVFIPAGRYYISDTIPIRQVVHIKGEGTSSVLYFASGKSGFIFNRSNTPAGQAGLSGAADNSIMENLELNQRGTKTGGYGVILHCTVTLQNMRFNAWGNYAIYINAGAATASLYKTIRRVMMIQQGTAYTSAPTVTFAGTGTGATGTAVLSSSIISATIIDSGRAYYSIPTAIVGSFGTQITESNIETLGYGARVTPTMGVDTIWFPNKGSGYTTATLTITGSTAASASDPAVCEAVVGEDGDITAINVLHAGAGYNAVGSTVDVVITGDGTDATAHAVIAGDGSISSVVVDDGGENYTQAGVDVDITGGASVRPNAHATAIISGGQIIGAVITDRGRGYPTAGDVHIAISGDGTLATATATLQVVGATVNTVGALYESAPTITFVGGRHNSGHDATGVGVQSTTKAVKRVIINTAGTGYTRGATISFSGGGGSGAIAEVALYGDRLGNANRWKCKNIYIDDCAGGIWTEGSDANAGYAEEIKITNCRFIGIREGSFLGNTYIACHTQTNKMPYMAISNTGLNTTFYNCYSEGGQVPSVGVSPARLIGGDHGAGVVGSWRQPINTFTGASSGSVEFSQAGSTNIQTLGLLGNSDDGEILKFYNSTTTEANKAGFFLDKGSGSFHFNYDGPTNNRGFFISGPYTTSTFGRSTAQPYSMFIDKLRIGSSTAAGRLITNGTAMPSSGEYAAGDLVLKSNPSTSDNIFGWMRLTTGSAHVLGTDWLALSSAGGGGGPSSLYIWNNPASSQSAFFDIYGGSNIIRNANSLTPLSITNSGLDIVTRGVNNFHAALNIYKDAATSGLHLASVASGSGNISGGGYRVSTSTYKTLETAMSSLGIGTLGLAFSGISGQVAGAEVTLNRLMTVTIDGKMAIGANTTPTAYLHLPAGTATANTAPLKFTEGTALTSTEKGVMNFVSGKLMFTPGADGSTLKRIPLFSDGTPANGEVLIGNGTDFTKSTITAGTGISVTNGAGSVIISNNTGTGGVVIDSPEHTYAGTATWDATQPSGTPTHTYQWTQMGHMVTLRINLKYSVAGVTNTSVTIPLPSDCPTPAPPSGFGSAANEVVVGCLGTFSSLITATTSSAVMRGYLKRNSTNNGYIVGIYSSAATGAIMATAIVTYWTP